jgi:hypothetical protein
MAKRELHARAIEMRRKGLSYSHIKRELGVSKSSLSLWLREVPLSESQILKLHTKTEAQIERCRASKARKRSDRLQEVRARAEQTLGKLSKRELLLCGYFLYWGEGSKTQILTTSLSNTDPAALVFFKSWLELMGVPEAKMRVRLQLYADMNPEEEVRYWSDVLSLPRSSFMNPYIKTSSRVGLSYKQRFTHGTCNLLCHDRDIGERVHTSLEIIRDRFIAPGT